LEREAPRQRAQADVVQHPVAVHLPAVRPQRETAPHVGAADAEKVGETDRRAEMRHAMAKAGELAREMVGTHHESAPHLGMTCKYDIHFSPVPPGPTRKASPAS